MLEFYKWKKIKCITNIIINYYYSNEIHYIQFDSVLFNFIMVVAKKHINKVKLLSSQRNYNAQNAPLNYIVNKKTEIVVSSV